MNPFQSIARILTLLVIGPLTVFAVSVAYHAADFEHYTPEPGSVRLVTVPGWNR